MSHRLVTLLQLLPLSAFLVYAQWDELGGDSRWESAFVLAGCLALIQIVLLILIGARVNRVILGVNLFLLVGGGRSYFGCIRSWSGTSG